MLSKTHKTWKMNGKREKFVCATMGHLSKLKKTKMEVWESGEEEGAAGLFHADLISWSYHPCHSYLQNCHSYLQNCHSTTQNYKNATPRPLMLAHSLRWRGNDVAMMWWLSSTEYWCRNSKITSPKYLKIIKNKN